MTSIVQQSLKEKRKRHKFYSSELNRRYYRLLKIQSATLGIIPLSTLPKIHFKNHCLISGKSHSVYGKSFRLSRHTIKKYFSMLVDYKVVLGSFMTNRFAAMIALMNATIKTGALSCETPTNALSLKALRLLRENGFIYGFNEITAKKRNQKVQFPRAKIYFKYVDTVTPILKGLKIFKNTKSNYFLLDRSKLSQI